eukprot:15449884-Alexandrium_andersonii.AAC.1
MQLRACTLASLMACTCNVLSRKASGRLVDILSKPKDCHSIGMQSTRIKQNRGGGSCEQNKAQGWRVVQWGYGTGKFTNKAAGVGLALSPKLVGLSISEVHSPRPALQGRAGALRVRGPDLDTWAATAHFPPEMGGDVRKLLLKRWQNG